MIKKGDLIQSDQPTQASTDFRRKFSHNDPGEFVTNFVIYTGRDSPPKTFSEIPSGESPFSVR
jgi:hypothetical protein